MRIGIDMRAYSGSQYGGIVEYIRRVVGCMVKQGQEHEFKLFYNSRQPIQPLALPSQCSNVYTYEYHYPNKIFFLSTQLFNQPKVDELLGGVDVFLSPHILPIALSDSVRRVLVVHDISFQRFPQFFDAKRRVWHKTMHIKKQLHAAHHILTPSNATKSDIMSLYNIESHNISVTPLGVAYPKQQPSPKNWDILQQQFSLSSPYILSLCTLEPRKNITTLARAFDEIACEPAFQNLQLVIAGPFGWLYKDILKRIRESRFANRIVVTGSIPEALKYDLYAHASAFVYPSFFEGFGLQPLEAMNAGVPVVASYSSSIPEVVGNAALLVDPRNAKQIARAIQEVLQDNALRTNLIQAGYTRAQQFSWEKCAKTTLEVCLNR